MGAKIEMPIVRIHIINSEFAVCEDVDVSSPEMAREQALKGALEIATEEVRNGKPFFGAEVRIESADDTLDRLMVAVGVSSLQ